MRGVGGNHHEKVRLSRISCASQFTIPDTAGMSPDPACNKTTMRSSVTNQASRTPDFSCPLVTSISFSSSSPISLFLVHNSIIITEHKVKSSLSMSPCHDHEFTPSTAYAEYSIQDCFAFLHSHDHVLIPECSFGFRHASQHNRPPSATT